MFKHNFIELPSLTRIDGETRLYETPDGNRYPSVTTVLDKMSDKSGLIAWRKRVGDVEADKISSQATRRGTAVHKMCEDFVLNDVKELEVQMPSNIHMYKQLSKFLSADVDNIMCSESSLFSHYLKIAGTVDLIAEYKGKPAIIDFKTSGKLKARQYIENYFLQTALYSYMFWEMTNIMCPTIVIAIAIEEETEPQIFVERSSAYIEKARDICKAYHLKY
jgi:hypothetical protein